MDYKKAPEHIDFLVRSDWVKSLYMKVVDTLILDDGMLLVIDQFSDRFEINMIKDLEDFLLNKEDSVEMCDWYCYSIDTVFDNIHQYNNWEDLLGFGV